MPMIKIGDLCFQFSQKIVPLGRYANILDLWMILAVVDCPRTFTNSRLQRKNGYFGIMRIDSRNLSSDIIEITPQDFTVYLLDFACSTH